MRLNIGDLAEMFGVSRPTITAWTKDGMPAIEAGGKGKSWTYDSVECMQWWGENKFRPKRRGPGSMSDPFDEGDGRESIEEAERRKMIAQADKSELDLAKSARLVVPIEEVAFSVAEENARVRAKLMAIPNDVRMRVRSYFGGNKEMEEGVVGGVEEAILSAMAEIRGDDEIEADVLGE